ncbi:MAG: EamA family transporter [Gammaproteobacteria bacterium]|nr:EamA family transporter [Gammaproteobacteria bacterium]MCP5201430.1 EamA family transporter [Gammaproteobacteria bacterium]
MRRDVVARFHALPGGVRAGVWMSTSAVTYAATIACGRHLAPDLAVFEIAFLRNAFAALFMVPWFLRVGFDAMHTTRFPRHLLRGAVSAVNVSLLFAAVARIPIADMAAINFLQPVIGAAIAGLLLGEIIDRRRWAAIALGLVGALVMIRPGFTVLNAGILFALGSAAAGAVVAILIKTLVRTEPPDAIAAWLFVTQSTLLLLPTVAVWRWPRPEQWALFAVMGVMSVILQRTYNRGLAAADVSIAVPFNFTRLIWAALLGWLVFGEFPDAWTWAGGSLIFAASLWLTRLAR